VPARADRGRARRHVHGQDRELAPAVAVARHSHAACKEVQNADALKDFATPGGGAPLTTEGVAAVSRQLLLAEIPQQLLAFMEMARILPNPRPTFPPPAAVPVAPVVGLEDVYLHPHGATAGAGATV
jgi:hypothetical protein